MVLNNLYIKLLLNEITLEQVEELQKALLEELKRNIKDSKDYIKSLLKDNFLELTFFDKFSVIINLENDNNEDYLVPVSTKCYLIR